MKAYIAEAVEAEKAGLKVALNTTPKPIPDELKRRLEDNPSLKAAFYALTPGRQRGYIFHLSSAKQSKTREARIDKCVPQILAGKGFNE